LTPRFTFNVLELEMKGKFKRCRYGVSERLTIYKKGLQNG